MSNQEEKFRIKFDKEEHDISADTYGYVLLSINEIVQEINKELGTGARVQVKVTAQEGGSFEVDITLIQGLIQSLLTYVQADPLKATGGIFSILLAVLKLRQFLHKESPKQIESKDASTTVTNVAGNQMIFNGPVLQIYNNSTVRDSLDKAFLKMSEDGSLKGFEVQDEKKQQLFHVTKEEMEQLTEGIPLILDGSSEAPEPEEKTIERPDVTLYIVRPSFDAKLEWTFVYRSRRVSMKFESDAFRQLGSDEEEFKGFHPGDSLEVDLQVSQRKDPIAGVYVDVERKYKILKVKKHNKQAEQRKLL